MTDNPKTSESDRQRAADDKVSPAGTHDKPELTDKDKTPGSGMMPDGDSKEIEGPSG